MALFEKGYYLVTSSHLVVHANYSAWGWTHLGLGALFILVGFGVLAGQTWARVVGIALAVISAIINLAFLAAYPVWGVIFIALDIVVIYALAMHGGEMRKSDPGGGPGLRRHAVLRAAWFSPASTGRGEGTGPEPPVPFRAPGRCRFRVPVLLPEDSAGSGRAPRPSWPGSRGRRAGSGRRQWRTGAGVVRAGTGPCR